MAAQKVKSVGPWRHAAGAQAPLSSPIVRRSNALTVLRVLQRKGAASRVDLARETGLTSTTVYRLAEHLAKLNLIVITGVDSAREGAGRRPTHYRFNPAIAAMAAADVGNETTRVALADAYGAIFATDQMPTSTLGGDLTNPLEHRIRQLAVRASYSGHVVGISVGIAAIVDRETGVVVRASQHREWDGVALREQLATALGCPASISQDDHLAALAEFASLTSYLGDETVVVVNQGKGLGAGFIIQGRPYFGAHGAAGRLESWLPPAEDGSPSLGDVMTSDALIDSYQRLGGKESIVDGKSLCAAARNGDAVARQVVHNLATRLGRVFYELAVAFDPDVMILGGGFAGSHDLFEPEISRRLEVRPRPPEFLVSKLGDQAVILGAVQNGLEHIDRHIAALLESA